ncbi:MAG: universal stress protein [Balneolaceae bacterium]
MTKSSDLKHALVALDHSQASDIMVECLKQFEQFGTEKFTLFTSVPVSYPGGLSTGSEKQYHEKMSEFEKKLKPLKLVVETDIQFKINGYVPSEILRAAKKHKSAYIIIANRGYNKFRELLLGSTVTELLQRCHLPVYLINLSVTDDEDMNNRKLYCVKSCADSLKRIFHPTDFSPTANRAFNQICKLVSDKTEKISMLHVQAAGRPGVEDPEQLEKFDREDTKRLQERKKQLEKLTDADIEIFIEYGSPSDKILAGADKTSSTMIILGSQGRGYVEDLFLGGVCLNVIRRSTIPVLTIPAHRNQNDT